MKRATRSPSGYSPKQRAVESAALLLWVAFTGAAGARLFDATTPADGPILPLAVCLAALLADFLSGVAHWAFDTWGDTDVPVFGKGVIRGFREHHVDPAAITRHDFVETNGAVALATLPLLLFATTTDTGRTAGRFLIAFVLSLVGLLVATNQIHRWAHEARPRRLVRVLQRLRVVLPPGHHAIHHAAPFDTHYCITTGWLNGLLALVGFFPAAERAIHALTGAIPRRHDQGRVPEPMAKEVPSVAPAFDTAPRTS